MFFSYSTYSKDELYARKSKLYDQLNSLKRQINRAYDELNHWKMRINVYHDQKSGAWGSRAPFTGGFWGNVLYGGNLRHNDLLHYKRKRDSWKSEIEYLKGKRSGIYADINNVKAHIQSRRLR